MIYVDHAGGGCMSLQQGAAADRPAASTPPLLILITGPPCTGKTTLGRRISEDFGLPFFYKDGFKERMYDIVKTAGQEAGETADGAEGGIERETSRLLGRFSIECLKIVLEAMLASGQSLVIEANFDSGLFSPYLDELRARYAFGVAQIQLVADGETLLARFVQREHTTRHPGHQGLKHLDSIRPVLLRGEQPPLRIKGDLLRLDTTDFDRFPYERVHELCARLLASSSV